MEFLITGGSGLIGRKLIDRLVGSGHKVHNLGRSAKMSGPSGLQHHQWDGKTIPDSVPKVDVVVNLAGANVGQRWTERYKEVILQSRVDSTKACVDYINRMGGEGMSLLSASGINYYGDLIEKPVDESSPAGDSFLSKVCQAWEAATSGCKGRVVIMRTSVVLDGQEGPLAKMLSPYKMFVGGPTGSGRQGFSWIHIDDMIEAILFLAENKAIEGAVNMVSPATTSQNQFSDALAKVLGRPNFFRLPKWILELVFGEMSAILWGGSIVRPKALLESGFQFSHPEIGPALNNLLAKAG